MQYVKWANKTDLDDFWTDPKVKRLFKNHIYAMTSRTNVYNGKRWFAKPYNSIAIQAAASNSVSPMHNSHAQC